jgi:hypothetical protein
MKTEALHETEPVKAALNDQRLCYGEGQLYSTFHDVPESEVSAEFGGYCVTAVNSHAKLVEALNNARKAMEMARQCGQFPDWCLEAIKDARAVLAEVEGGK